jgi:D-serine deaminase-like pyridoxal phosphate-dependent protein
LPVRSEVLLLLQESLFGVSVQELETPSVIIDTEQMERNLVDMADFCRKQGIKLRPHSKTHKIPELALKQIDQGAVGVCTQKVSEAQVMIEGGVKDIFVSNEIVDPGKLRLFARLSEKARLSLCVDSVEGVRNLSTAAQESGVELSCLVDIDCGMHRCGVSPHEASKLASIISSSKNLVFKGIMGYEGHVGGFPRNEWPGRVREAMAIVSDAKREIHQRGLSVDNVIVGGTPTAKISGTYPDVTEITPGEYIFYDYGHVETGLVKMNDVAISVLCTVISRPEESRAVIDGGLKTFDFDQGEYPGLRKRDKLNAKVVHFSEEHGVLQLNDAESKKEMQIGKKFEFVPYHVCTCVNLHNSLIFVRNGRVERAVVVLGRGMVR